ncbi:MAG: hydantoinase/oxoprolinase family protein [Candidatus Caldarchaeum sp.]
MKYIVGIDTGGTFTDGVVVDREGDLLLRLKVVTTPYDLTECFIELLSRAAEKVGLDVGTFLSRCESIRYSQTIATNTFITKTGTKLGLVVTRGYEDDLYSGRRSPPLLNLVSRDLIAGVEEDVDQSGIVRSPLSQRGALEVVEQLLDKGARALVVSLRNSYANPVHEDMILEVVKKEYPPHYLGSVPLFLSHKVVKIRDDYVRTCTAVVNAYIHRRMATYLYKAEDYTRANGYNKQLFVVTSDGAVSTIPWTKAISTIGSGPAAGVIGAYLIMKQIYGLNQVVTVDLGGTSLDMGIVKGGVPELTYYTMLDGITVFQPMISVESLAVGGGSLVKLSGDKVLVGPESAGSMPGPACFGRGGDQPTPTDANLLLGYLDPEGFLGGSIPLKLELASEAIRRSVAGPLGVDVVEASCMVRRSVDEKIAVSLRTFLERRGAEGKVTCYFYGGGGPLHACSILSRLKSLERAYVFPYSSEFSALGCCMLDIGHHYYREVRRADSTKLRDILEDMIDRARRDIEGEGFSADEVALEALLYAGYGSGFVPIPLNADAYPDQATGDGEALIIILKSVIPTEKPRFKAMDKSTPDSAHALKGWREAYWTNIGMKRTPVYEMHMLRPGNIVDGPAIIQAEDTTVLIEPEFTYSVDEFGNGVIERSE